MPVENPVARRAVTHPVARTAFYCCILRADDAARPVPVCGDGFAARFVDDDIRRELAGILSQRAPAAGNVARHRLIDDLVRECLASDPARRVILVGAGFDTRAFRLGAGQWFEIDDAGLLAFKEERLPVATAPRPLQRIAVDFSREKPLDYLAPLSGEDRALVVIEGVTMYLDDTTLHGLGKALRARLPNATLVCDLMSQSFRWLAGFGMDRALARLGAPLATHLHAPEDIIEAVGYRLRSSMSIVGRAREAGTVWIPGWLFHGLLRELRDGYAVCVFEPAEERERPADSWPASDRWA